MIDILVSGLIEQANQVSGLGQRAAEHIKYQVVFVTPDGSYDTIGVDGYSEFGDFIGARTVDMEISIRMQPSLYINKLLPNKDNLIAQLITTDLTNRTVQEFTAIPLLDTDVKAEGNNSYHADVDGISHTTFNSYRFQLMEPIFAKLRTVPVSHISLMSTVEKAISYIINTETVKAIEGTTYKYEGLIMDYPISNDTVYKALVVKEGIKAINVPVVLQEDDRYGVYNTGLGFYFKQRKWWCYTLFDLKKYGKSPRTVNIIRFPENKAPTLQYTFFVDTNTLTILSTGKASQTDETDIERQNSGVGKRIIEPTLISGETGVHYNAGRAVKTRADSMSEYSTSTRKSGDEYIPVHPVPTSNICKHLSANNSTNGTLIRVPWHCGDPGYLQPGVGIRYTFMGDKDKMETRNGVLLGYRMDTEVIDGTTLLLKRGLELIIFLDKSTEE